MFTIGGNEFWNFGMLAAGIKNVQLSLSGAKLMVMLRNLDDYGMLDKDLLYGMCNTLLSKTS